jgi:hypothetical protein
LKNILINLIIKKIIIILILIIGRNCRFLQGPGTDQNAVNIIRKGVKEGRDISVCLLNYKADGTPFWNQFFVGEFLLYININ